MNRRRLKEAAKRLQEVDRIVRTLDPAVRGQAFSLSGYAVGRDSTVGIIELVQLVLREGAADMKDDLRELLKDVARLNEQKSKLRDLLDRLAQESAEIDELLRREYEDLFVETDGLGDFQLRLQTAMDRQGKLLETLSDILKKLSCTEREIVQNLK